MNNLGTLQDGSTTGDAELIGIRTGYDGTNYPSAGEAVRTQISDIIQNCGKWIYTVSGIARSFKIPISVVDGDIIYVKPLSWDGEEYSSITIYGYKSTQYIALGSVLTLNSEKFIDIHDDYEFIQIMFNTASIPSVTRTAKIKIAKLKNDTITSNICDLNKKSDEIVNQIVQCDERIANLKNQYNDVVFSNTDAARFIDIPVSANSGETVYFKPFIWTGDTFTQITLYGAKSGQFTPLGAVNKLNKSNIIVLNTNYDSFRLGFGTSSIPTEIVTGATIFSILDNISFSNKIIESFNLIEDINEKIIRNIDNDIECFCSTMYAVVGQEINIYYDNIMKCENISNYKISVLIDNSTVMDDSFILIPDGLRITPNQSQIGTHTITLQIMKNNYVLKTFSFSLIINDATQKNIKAMFIGDSITQQAGYISEAKSLIGDSMELYGTLSTTTRTFSDNSYDKVIYHEGRGGWTTTNYCNNETGPGNVSNPFYNNGFDFNYYMTNHTEFNDVTDVFILLGTNDTQSDINVVTQNLQTMIDSIHSFRNNIKVHVGLPIPPCKDEFHKGSTSIWNHKISMWNFCKKYVETLVNCTFIPYNACIDCWYGFSRERVPIAKKLTYLVERPTDYFHPAEGGFQMGDELYAEIMANS